MLLSSDLIKDDDPLITRGTIQECPVFRLEDDDANDVDMEGPQNEKADKEDNTVKTLQNILKICESAKKELENNYTDAENVLKELQTENTTLKIQLNMMEMMKMDPGLK